MIAYYFPPFGKVGSYRVSKFVKYLPIYKWEPIVLTVKEKYYENALDQSLLKDIPQKTCVIRTNAFFTKIALIKKILNFILIPDLKILWMLYAHRSAEKVVAQKNVNLIYATGGPFSSFVFAYLLSKKTRKKFIVDFRDAWILDPRNKQANLLGRIKIVLSIPIFKIILKHSSAIILATDGMYKDFLRLFPMYKKKLYLIDNGFDEDDFLNHKFISKNDTFTITFSGSAYVERDLTSFFQSIEYIQKSEPQIYKKLKIDFWGFFDDSFRKKCKNISDIITINKRIKHELMIEKIMHSDMLLFVGENISNNQQINSSKIFEYLATGKPILTIVNKDMGGYKIIKNSGLGVFCDFQNPVDIANKIIATINNETKIKPNLKFIKQYSRKRLTQKFSHLLNQTNEHNKQ